VIQDRLEQVYGKAGIRFTVSYGSKLSIPGWDEDGDGRVHKEDETGIISDFAKGNLSREILHLLIFRRPMVSRSRSSIAGLGSPGAHYLYLAKNYGDGSPLPPESIGLTCAHELGHIIGIPTRTTYSSDGQHDRDFQMWPNPGDESGSHLMAPNTAEYGTWLRKEEWDAVEKRVRDLWGSDE
jgi:hypothetical protein